MSYQQDIFNLISSFTGHNANYVIPKEFMRLIKDSNAVLVLSQLVYWTGKGTNQDGWIYKSYKEWEDEIFLSQKVVMTATKKLKKIGVLETEVRKIRLPGGLLTNQTCVHYRVVQEKLAELITNQLKTLGNAEREFPGNSYTEFPEKSEREFPSIITNNTSKITTTTLSEIKQLDQDQESEPSSSFSENDLVVVLAGLLSLIPEQFQKPFVESTIKKSLGAYSEGYIKNAILYTIAHSNGLTAQKFKAYLGKCIDGGWADCWEPDHVQMDYEQRKANFLESRRRMPDDILRADAERGCKVSAQVLIERGF